MFQILKDIPDLKPQLLDVRVGEILEITINYLILQTVKLML